MPFSTSGIHFLMVTSAAITLAVIYLYHRKKKSVIPSKEKKSDILSDWKEVGTVSKLNLYPLKSGQRIELTKAECTNVGLRQISNHNNFLLRDRFLIVFKDKDHEFRTARNYPKLLLVSVTAHDKNHLKLAAPAMDTLIFKIPDIRSKQHAIIAVKFHDGERVQTVDCGDEVATWLSKYLLDKPSGLRLGFNDGSFKRDITKVHKELINYCELLSNKSTGLYADLSSILLINQKSVDDLNSELENSDVTTNNFRPNIVVDGTSLEPYAEDNWNTIKIGDVEFRNVLECTRCIMTTINPETAIRSTNGEPLKSLKMYRVSKRPGNEPIMGINLEVIQDGVISVGDNVFVTLK